jgi:hypothetical protein
MSGKNAILVGCGTAALLGLLMMGLMVAFVVHVIQDPEGMEIAVRSPLDVAAGETFTVAVDVTNRRERKALTVPDVDICNVYLEGFVIVATDPVPQSVRHVPIDNSLSHVFNKSIGPGETETFTFSLRAEKPGIFRGDVDVCEGARFTTATVQTVVKK